MIRVSVIIPAYNASRFIVEAMASIYAQSFGAWELIVVDDGSSDDTAAKVEAAAQDDSRIVLLRQPNRGEAMARAQGLIRAKGEYVYFLDADDVAYADALERLCKALDDSPHAVAAYGTHRRMAGNGVLLFPDGRLMHDVPRRCEFMLDYLLCGAFLAVGAVMIRRPFIQDEDIAVPIQYSEDWVMWVRLALKGDFVFAGQKPLVKHRLHEAGQSRGIQPPERWMQAVELVYAMPELMTRYCLPQLALMRKRREAFVYFSLACKHLAVRDYDRARQLLRQCVGYRCKPVWYVLYCVTWMRWLPAPLRWHMGIEK